MAAAALAACSPGGAAAPPGPAPVVASTRASASSAPTGGAADAADAPERGALVWRTREVRLAPAPGDPPLGPGETPAAQREHDTLWIAAGDGHPRVVGRIGGLHAVLGERLVRLGHATMRVGSHGLCPGDPPRTQNSATTSVIRLEDASTTAVVFERSSMAAPKSAARWSTRLELVGSAGPYWFVHELRRYSTCASRRPDGLRPAETTERVPLALDARSGAPADALAREIRALAAPLEAEALGAFARLGGAAAANAARGLDYAGFTAKRDAIEVFFRARCEGCADDAWPADHVRGARLRGVPATLEAEWADTARAAALTPDTAVMGTSLVTPGALRAVRRAFERPDARAP